MPLRFTDNRTETGLIDRRLSVHSGHTPFSVAGVRAYQWFQTVDPN